MSSDCPFCGFPAASRVLESDCFYAIYDKYPVNPGHLLIITNRHTPDLLSLNQAEIQGLHCVVDQAIEVLSREHKPDGYNIGVNCGETAGQTIFHFHLHIIPRYKDDVESPRGGIRNFKDPIVRYE